MVVMFMISFLLLGFIIYGYKKGNENTKDISIQHLAPVSTKPSNSKSSKLSVLHLSDLHLENISISPAELYEKVKDHPIDVIALTGDFLDRKRTIPKLIPYLEVFQKLSPTYGTFAVFGNHDYVLRKEPFQQLERLLQDYDCQTLRNETVTIQTKDGTLNIIGIDDFSTKRSDLKESYENVENGYNLVLTHDPNIVMHMKDYHFDYLLSGHFHGGQICWPKPYHLVKMGKLVRLNMVKGLHFFDGKPFYISEGLGQTGLNIRVGSRPEITFHQVDISSADSLEMTS
ncbi:metallophosphoesterase [Bacillus pinisoli]|uniref:metallophosphoesterase n=1 Tax=Bacillus pinisoli TaxID=2901866 RepID=UPI001FF69077|nr:metallophosphoesterase [Bacillus pinisoli]